MSHVRRLLPLLAGMIGVALASGVATALATDAPPVTLGPRDGHPIAFRLLPDGAGASLPAEIDLGPERLAEAGAPGGDGSFRRESEASLPGRSAGGWRLAADDAPTPIAEPARVSGPDWPGIGRDTAFFLGYQVVGVAVIYAIPGGFKRPSNEVSLETWWDNVKTPPVWDDDHWTTNYITHPYWGAAYYIRARERGFGKLASFGYSALLSTLFEYGAEAFFEVPRRRI